MSLSVRIRFEVFKRDDFTCQYCGKKSPEVVLEADHIVPKAEGGSDDIINLRTSCWACNSGKSDKPLNEIVTGEDPHDRAILLLERERQLREYNTVLARDHQRREADGWELVRYWKTEQGYTSEEELNGIGRQDWNWLFSTLSWCPKEVIRNFMDQAIYRYNTKNLKYVAGCCRNWRYEKEADQHWRDSD